MKVMGRVEMFDMHRTGKLQTFVDGRYGNTATLRIDQNSDKPFVLRCRSGNGRMFFKEGYETAHKAKLALDRVTDPDTHVRCNWFTEKGYVFDILN